MSRTSVWPWWMCALLTTSACALEPDELGDLELDAKVVRKVTVVSNGDGAGDVASTDGAIACGAACTAGYAPGKVVTLTATPRYDSRFVGWQGAGCSGTGPCTFRVTRDEIVIATFARQPVLTIDKAGSGQGSVFVPPDLDCSAAALGCSQVRPFGEPVTLTATPAPGSTFEGWSGACAGSSATCTLSITADVAVTATFTSAASTSPLVCSAVSSMVTDTGGGIYFNWIGAWTGVTAGTGGDRLGYLLPWDEPNTPDVETQFYFQESVASTPGVLAIGPSNSGYVPEQLLTLETDAGPITVYMPAMNPDDCVRTRFYVASDGSTYHSRADHDYTYSPARANIFTETCFGDGVVGPDLTPEQAMVPQHLARAAR